MKVLITGASGLIGQALVDALEERGDEPVPVTRSASGGESAVRWDPQRGELNPEDVSGYDAIIHLAGEGIGDKRWTETHKARVLDSRVRATTLLAETLAEVDRSPAVLVSASAVGFYGHRGDEVLTEQSEGGDDFLSDVCRQWEQATQPARDAGIRVATIRTGLVMTPEGGILPRILLPFRLGVGGRLGPGSQWWPWITMQDEIAAILYVLDNDDLSGPVNLSAPNPVTNAEFTRTLAQVLRRPGVFSVPSAALKLILGEEMASELLLVSQRVRPQKLLDSGFEFAEPDLEPALRTLLDKPGV
ncbi:MAG: TIGR01777 family oxidoreductase [Actinomycetota bacterium]|nr:TIGR01777 family oxidoreductase [Actinomycetota bacterium]